MAPRSDRSVVSPSVSTIRRVAAGFGRGLEWATPPKSPSPIESTSSRRVSSPRQEANPTLQMSLSDRSPTPTPADPTQIAPEAFGDDPAVMDSAIDASPSLHYQADAIPTWWSWAFGTTLLFAPLYVLVHHSGNPDRTSRGAYEVAMNRAMQKQFDQLGDVQLERESMVRFLGEPSWLQVGRGIFRANCASCHGAEGAGGIGPNLCDDHYKNIAQLDDFLNVLTRGAGGGAMPAWRGKLSDTEIVLVSAYAASLRHTDPAGAKAAEGREIPAWDL